MERVDAKIAPASVRRERVGRGSGRKGDPPRKSPRLEKEPVQVLSQKIMLQSVWVVKHFHGQDDFHHFHDSEREEDGISDELWTSFGLANEFHTRVSKKGLLHKLAWGKTYHFIGGRHDLAAPLWDKYVKTCPQIMFQKVCQTARATLFQQTLLQVRNTEIVRSRVAQWKREDLEEFEKNRDLRAVIRPTEPPVEMAP